MPAMLMAPFPFFRKPTVIFTFGVKKRGEIRGGERCPPSSTATKEAVLGLVWMVLQGLTIALTQWVHLESFQLKMIISRDIDTLYSFESKLKLKFKFECNINRGKTCITPLLLVKLKPMTDKQ